MLIAFGSALAGAAISLLAVSRRDAAERAMADSAQATPTMPTRLPAPEPSPSPGVQQGDPAGDPEVTIDQLLEAYEGRELEMQLSLLGRKSARLGIEEAKRFILQLPPGSYGRTAMGATLDELDCCEGELVTWILEEAELSKDWAEHGFNILFPHWAKKDLTATLKYLTSTSDNKLLDYQRIDFLGVSLGTAVDAGHSEAALIAAIESIQDAEFREKAYYAQPILRLRLERNAEEAIKEIAELKTQPIQRLALGQLIGILQNSNNRSGIIDLIIENNMEYSADYIPIYISRWAKNDLNDAMDYVATIKDSQLRDSVIKDCWKVIAQYDKQASWKWIQTISDPTLRTTIEQAFTTSNE